MKTLSKKLTKQEIENFGIELEGIRKEIMQKVGEEDANHIRRVANQSRYYEIMGRLFIHFSLEPLSFSLGVGFLSLAKILNNMELGHNVLHGQYDWMNDPEFNSKTFEWDIVSDAKQWKFYHNYIHHTFTNVIGKDHDFGYHITRLSSEQKWTPANLFQPVLNLLLAFNFEWGVGKHGYNVEFLETPKSKRKGKTLQDYINVFLSKVELQLVKDYVVFPILGGVMAPKIFLGNLFANTIRNLWTYSIIYCGHFTENSETFTIEEMKEEGKGGWYLRQLKGSSNIEGSKLFHLLSGHLSHQIEHHLFPDMPSSRYEEVAPRIKEICEKYEQHYNTGSFVKQFASVWKKIFKFSLPDELIQKREAIA
jgi:linoleoyl-CoA desaturase